MATLLGLPDELLLKVTDNFPGVRNLLNLRLVCRRLSEVALDAQVKRMNAIYLDPSKSSLQRFRNICHSARHAAGIQEVYYVAQLHKVPCKRLVQGHDFRSAAVRYCPKWLINLVALKFCEKDKAESQQLLRSGEVERVVTECVPLLPNIHKISFLGHPMVHHVSESTDRQCVYNSHRSWNCWGSRAAFEQPKSPSLLEWARKQLRFAAQYESESEDFDSLATIVRPLGSLSDRSLPQGIYIGCAWCPTAVVDKRWTDYASAQASKAEKALRFVSGIILCLEPADGLMSGHMNPIDMPALNHWVSFVGALQWLRQLTLCELNREGSAVSRAIVVTHTFSLLEHLHITSCGEWNVGPPFDSAMDPHRYTTGELSRFLVRHARTLQHLKLSHASTIQNPTPGVRIAAFQALIRTVKTGLPNLKSAVITERFHIWLEDEDGLVLAVCEQPEHDCDEHDREVERSSEIGRYARQCGAEVIEDPPYHPIAQDEDEDDFGPPDDDENRRDGLLCPPISFSYDFGPYVLRRDGEH